MSIQPFPRPLNLKTRRQTDDQLAKLGQLNQLVTDTNAAIVGKAIQPVTSTGIPFENYPPAELFNAGPKYVYTDGVNIISYHIRGIIPSIDDSGSISQYLCTVNVAEPLFFPGSITGMVSTQDSGGTYYNTPLANGALIYSANLNGLATLSGVSIQLYPYMSNPQPDGSFNFALVLEATASDINLSGLISYDFELGLPSSLTLTIFQD